MKEKAQRRIEALCKGLVIWRRVHLQTAFSAGGVALACLVGLLTASNAFAQTIVDEWPTVQTPKPPELKSVTIDPKVTALLI